MQKWKDLIQNSQKAYVENAYADAIRLNRSALLLSMRDFEKSFSSNDPDGAIASVLVCYFNIIDNYIAQNKSYTAETLFENIFNFLNSLINNSNNNKKQINAIAKGLKKLNMEWSLFCKNNKINSENEWVLKLKSLFSNLTNNNKTIH